MLRNRLRALAVATAAAIAFTTVSLTPAHAGRRGDAAMIGAVAGMFGLIATMAAASAARERYYDGPVYVAPQPVPAPHFHGHPGWRGRHFHHHRHHGQHRHWHR